MSDRRLVKVPLYEIYSGKELEIAQKIQQRRLQILVHSHIYYVLDTNIVSDHTWMKWANELVELQKTYPGIAKTVIWNEAFEDFDGSTGCNLPLHDPWVVARADWLLEDHDKYGNNIYD